jgi:hypothetical protein
MSCCKSPDHVTTTCLKKCKRRCPKIRRCKFKQAKWTCPWSLCAGGNALTCCR